MTYVDAGRIFGCLRMSGCQRNQHKANCTSSSVGCDLQAAKQELVDLAQTRHSVREVHSLMARQIHLFREHRQVRTSCA